MHPLQMAVQPRPCHVRHVTCYTGADSPEERLPYCPRLDKENLDLAGARLV